MKSKLTCWNLTVVVVVVVVVVAAAAAAHVFDVLDNYYSCYYYM